MALNLTAFIPGVGHEYANVVTATLVVSGVLFLGIKARKDLGEGEQAIIPMDKISVRGLFEALVEFISGLATMVIGHEGRKFVPFFSIVFLYILIDNLVGVIPGMAPATEDFNTTFSMGCVIFVFYNFLGLKYNGLGYIKHLFGPVLWLAPLMFVVELISHLVRPLSLGLRLANVLRGDHIVVGIFTDLVPILLPIPFYILGIFVCFVQAFVFTLLSMVYVSLATAHDH